MNNVNLVGRICKDLNLRRTQNNDAVMSYTLAVKRPGSKDKTDFLDCVAWKQGAEFLSQYAGKGDMVAVSGSLQCRDYTDKDGNNRRAYEVVTDRVELVSRKKQESGQSAAPAGSQIPQSSQYGQQNPLYGQQNSFMPQGARPGYYQRPADPQYPELTDDDGQMPF